jgi:hypothetical protein
MINQEGFKMKKATKILVFISLSLLVSTPIIAQCTDDDSDGYYYEEGCWTDRDCNDANPNINPGAEEICNGYDDDCDASIDEVCDTICDNPEKWGSENRVTYDPGQSEDNSLVWTGSEYGVVWDDDRDKNLEIYFARLDSSGDKIASDYRVTHYALHSYNPSLVWTGIEYGISWFDERDGNWEIYFARLNSLGSKIGLDIRVTNNSSSSEFPSLAWTGIQYGVSWQDDRDGNDEIYFTRLDSSGSKIGSDIRVTSDDDSSSGGPSLVWTGSEYGIAWQDTRHGPASEIYFTRLDSSGEKLGSDIRISYSVNSSGSSSLVWTGSEFGVSWSDSGPPTEIYFARLDSTGSKQGSDVYVNDGSVYSLTWNGSEYGIAYEYQSGSEIYISRLDASGIKLGSDLRLTYDSAESDHASLAWTGNEYGVSWDDWRDGNEEIYFVRMRCCDDVDMDTHTECVDCDDNDDTVYPGAEELCDLKDNDCDGTIDEGFPTPGATMDLIFDNDKATMGWNTVWTADRYDVMKGNLMALRATDGDFTSSLSDCLENDSLDTQSFDSDEPSAPGDGYYYIVRAQADCRNGTCNCGHPKQVGDRDEEIDDSSNKCP